MDLNKDINNQDIIYDDSVMADSETLYLREIGKYPLLTFEEEQDLAHDISLKKDLNIITEIQSENGFNNITSYTLNIPLIFGSCINNSDYKEIINKLIGYFSNKENGIDKDVFNELSKYKKLATELGRSLNEGELGNYFQINISDIHRLDQNTLFEEVESYLKYKYALDKMVTSNLRLVAKEARRFDSGHGEFLDLVNLGNMGLIKAAEDFDYSYGVKFSTYAVPKIKREIIYRLQYYRYTKKLPLHARENFVEIGKRISELESEKGRHLSSSEILTELNISNELLQEYYNYNSEVIYLNQSVDSSDDEDLFRIDLLTSKDNIEDIAFKDFVKDEIAEILKCLKPQELEVIKQYYGVGGEEPLGLKEISKRLGLTTQRISKIKLNAERRIRNSQDSKVLALKKTYFE